MSERETHTSFEAFAISENAGIAIVMDFLCDRCSRRFEGLFRSLIKFLSA